MIARVWGSPTLTALLLVSLSMATSPASLMRVVNEQRSSGQVTQRVLHLAAVNCVLALFAFKVVVGFWTFESSGDLVQAIVNSVVALLVSAGLGAACLRLSGETPGDDDFVRPERAQRLHALFRPGNAATATRLTR